jgi:anti-sigma factor RsiW
LVTCTEFLQQLGDYLDDELDASFRAEVARHVSGCNRCWIMWDTTRKTVRLYKGAQWHPLTPDLEARLMAAIEKKMGGTSRRRRHGAAAGSASSAPQ